MEIDHRQRATILAEQRRIEIEQQQRATVLPKGISSNTPQKSNIGKDKLWCNKCLQPVPSPCDHYSCPMRVGNFWWYTEHDIANFRPRPFMQPLNERPQDSPPWGAIIGGGIAVLILIAGALGSGSRNKTDGVFESAVEKIDKGKSDALTREEKQRLHDITVGWCKYCKKPKRHCPHG